MKFLVCRLFRRPFECLDKVSEVRFERPRVIFGDEREAFLMPLAQGCHSTALHGRDDREPSPDFGMTVE
jgi:hypothetical protein